MKPKSIQKYICLYVNVILCLCRFADTEVRSVAVSWIEKSSDDELADYLPQLVQVANNTKINVQMCT